MHVFHCSSKCNQTIVNRDIADNISLSPSFNIIYLGNFCTFEDFYSRRILMGFSFRNFQVFHNNWPQFPYKLQ